LAGLCGCEFSLDIPRERDVRMTSRVDPKWATAMATAHPVRFALAPFVEDREAPRCTWPGTRISIIIGECAIKHGVPIKEIKNSDNRKVFKARHETCYRLRKELCLSWPKIAQLLKLTHHSTAMYGAWRHAQTSGLDAPCASMEKTHTPLHKQYHRIYRQANKQRILEYNRAWRKQKRQARKDSINALCAAEFSRAKLEEGVST
jgi:hypothetical protein